MDSQIEGRLKAVIEAARQHPFYRERFPEAPLHHQEPETALASLPATTKDDFRKILPAALKTYPRTDPFWAGVYWSPSGGTTRAGEPFYFPADARENRRQREMAAMHFKQPAPVGIFYPGTIAANIFPGGSMYRAQDLFGGLAELSDATVVQIGGRDTDAELVDLFRFLRVNTVVATPDRLTRFAFHVQSKGIEVRIPRIVFAAEALPEPKRKLLREALGVTSINAVYGSAESGAWAYQPDAIAVDQYLIAQDIMFAEVKDPDPDGFGNLMVTNLTRTRFPLVRYDMGDVVCIRTEEVGGCTRQVLQFRGRESRSFSFWGEFYALADFEPLVGDSPIAWQVVLDFDKDKGEDVLTVRVVLPPGATPEAKKTYGETLQKAIVQEIMNDLFTIIVDVTDLAALARAPRSNKVLPIVDRR